MESGEEMRKNLQLKVQILFTILTNGYAYGFLNGKIYQGTLKYACVPGLNCYSCPGALGSCPIGALQAVLNQRNVQIPFGVLGFLFLVVIGSVFLFGGFAKVPAFCKYLCPSGTLFGALPLLTGNQLLRSQAGGLFLWKLGILLVLVVLSVKIYRPFCQYLCPLGAVYGWFNRFSLVQIHWEEERCISCHACEGACPAGLSLKEISHSPLVR